MILFYYIVLLLVFIILIVFIYEFYLILFKGFASFVQTRKKIINKIIKELDIKENDVIMELGCGTAGFLRTVHKLHPKTKLIGIEFSPISYTAAYIQNKLGNFNIDIRKQNFFHTDISQADVIYCFSNVETMKKLESKFQKECKQGCKIVSLIFNLPNTKMIKKFEVNKFKSKAYIYEI